MMNCVRLVPGDAQLSYFDIYFMNFCTIFLFARPSYIYHCVLIHLLRLGMAKLIIIIKAFLPLKVASNYAFKQNPIVRLSARKMQMST